MPANAKLVFTIAACMGASGLVGFAIAVMLFVGTAGAVTGFVVAMAMIALGYGWWWRSMVLDHAREVEHREMIRQRREQARYVLPEDVEAELDQHVQAVNAIAQASMVAMDVEGRLRERMRQMAKYMTTVEDERDQLRVEADKVDEIKQVAARTPRLVPQPKTSPDDYGVKRGKEDIPGFLARDPGRGVMADLEHHLHAGEPTSGPEGPSEGWPAPAPLPG